MAPLVIGETERVRIRELRAYAAATPRDVYGVIDAAMEDIAAFRDEARTNSVFLPVGYAVNYTHEVQPNAPPPGLCHHISISVDRRNKLPAPAAVEMILEEFGLRRLAESHGVWIEDISPGERAVNVLQLVEKP